MTDLRSKYLGLNLKNPLVISAGPLSRTTADLRKIEDSNAAAVVLYSLFEEQIEIEGRELDEFLWRSQEGSAEAQSYYPNFEEFTTGPYEYLEHIQRAKSTVDIPVIASLNGVSKGGWTRYAKLIETAGADALELNIYFVPTDPTKSGLDLENMYVDLVAEVKRSVKIPVAVKLAPYFTSMAHFAKRLEVAGADGLVMFNRFYQPEFDLEKLEVEPHLTLSRSNELPLRLFWTAVLFGEVNCDLAVTGGVHVVEDVVRSMMAGARVTMLTSALLEQGLTYLNVLHEQLNTWLDEHEYESIKQMQGSMSRKRVAHPAAFERANYMKTLSSYSLGIPVR
jgi:dihydroorotate dehydrogenase (fumarate)